MLNQDFTTEEWQKITTLPQLAALYVASASPSGALGFAQELLAIGRQLSEAINQPSNNPIINAVVETYQHNLKDGDRVETPALSRDPEEMKALCLATCRTVADLLEQHAPASAEGYKCWVYALAQASAAAAKEGGFLGFGGVRVNIAEEDALDDIARALGLNL